VVLSKTYRENIKNDFSNWASERWYCRPNGCCPMHIVCSSPNSVCYGSISRTRPQVVRSSVRTVSSMQPSAGYAQLCPDEARFDSISALRPQLRPDGTYMVRMVMNSIASINSLNAIFQLISHFFLFETS
jgi:hypothetical protein